MGERKYYIGDAVQKKINSDGNKLEWLWGTELIGVTKNITLSRTSYVLFHRPFKNRIKHLLWWIYKIIAE